ncbi:MAG: Glyoxalase/bleomycin resistance protein/dioxygenase, partial [Phycisphaerales bacterium]|nr:Glyoxalase/bleomycin resistance protein/dioxygenase [Phycisphaerales bacterium]
MADETRLNLLVLRCRSIDATAAFYAHLGFAFDRHRHGGGPEHLGAERDGWVFELYPAKDGVADTAGLGFEVADLVAARQRLADAGFAPGDVRTEPWGTVCVARDPDGRRVELKHWEGEPTPLPEVIAQVPDP